MEPIGYGILIVIAGIIFLGVVVGSIGGAINGRVRGDLFLGTLLTAGAFFLSVILLESWSYREFGIFGLFPLVLTFLVGSLTSPFLEARLGLRPVYATLAAFGSAMLAGFSYMMLIRFGWIEMTDPTTAWIASSFVSVLLILSLRKWIWPTAAMSTTGSGNIKGSDLRN